MLVLIADSFEQSGREGLTVERIRPDVLVVRSTKVSEAILSAGPLKLVVRAGAGYNTIDVAAASRRGIYVSIARARTPSRLPNWHSASQTFGILRDPMSVPGAKRITSPKLQEVFRAAGLTQ